MRALTEKEIELIAGGQNSGGTRTITVTGHPPSTTFTTTFSPTGSGGSGDGGDSDTHQQMEEAKNTPCVHSSPEGVDEHTINNEAKYLGDELHSLHEADPNHAEYAAFIYKASDGQIYESNPIAGTSSADEVVIHSADLTNYVPAGATVVGFIHTHPDENTRDPNYLDQREPSTPSSGGSDSTTISRLLGATINGVHFDPEMLTYINATQNGSTNTYVYDKNHLNAGSGNPDCSL